MLQNNIREREEKFQSKISENLTQIERKFRRNFGHVWRKIHEDLKKIWRQFWEKHSRKIGSKIYGNFQKNFRRISKKNLRNICEIPQKKSEGWRNRKIREELKTSNLTLLLTLPYHTIPYVLPHLTLLYALPYLPLPYVLSYLTLPYLMS